MPMLLRDGISFHYQERTGSDAAKQALPFIFQHGIGGTVEQSLSLLEPLTPAMRVLAMDCRGHGETQPTGLVEQLTFARFADDIVALMDALQIPQAILGGISMGAGVALTVSLRTPERVAALVLSRPAWLDAPMGALSIYQHIAHLLRTEGSQQGRQRFEASLAYQQVLQESSDAARSLLGQFDEARAVEAVARLEYLPADRPIASMRALEAMKVPTLLLATREDPLHPFAYATALARSIPGAILEVVTSKSKDRNQHQQQMRQAISAFVHQQMCCYESVKGQM